MTGGLLTVMIQLTDKAPRTPLRKADEALLERMQGKLSAISGRGAMDTIKIHALSGRREKEIPPSARHLDGRKFASVRLHFSTMVTENEAIVVFTDTTDEADVKLHSLPGIENPYRCCL